MHPCNHAFAVQKFSRSHLAVQIFDRTGIKFDVHFGVHIFERLGVQIFLRFTWFCLNVALITPLNFALLFTSLFVHQRVYFNNILCTKT